MGSTSPPLRTRPCPGRAGIRIQVLPPRRASPAALEPPSRRGEAPHPLPSRPTLSHPIPPRLVLSRPTPHPPHHARTPPKQGNHRHPPGADGLPAGSCPRRLGGRVPSCCWVSAETCVRRATLPGVVASPGTDQDIPCSWLFVLSANCWHSMAAGRSRPPGLGGSHRRLQPTAASGRDHPTALGGSAGEDEGQG